MYAFHAKIEKTPLHLPIPFILVCLNTIQKNISRLLWSLVRRCIGTGLTFIIITRLLHFCTDFSLPFVQNQDGNNCDKNDDSSNASTNNW